MIDEEIISYIYDSKSKTLNNALWDFFDPKNRVMTPNTLEIEYLQTLMASIQEIIQNLDEYHQDHQE